MKWLVAGLCLALAACNPGKTAFQLGLPGSRVAMGVASVTQRLGYLDVELAGEGWGLRTYLPARETCARLVGGETVQYVSDGPYGSLVRGDDRCEAVGIGSLREWRDRRPRGDTARESIVPSATARYREVYRDEEVVFLRGRFPLAAKLGFPGMGDLIAVVPIEPACMRAIERTAARLEYFHAGRNVLTLSSQQGRCNIQGLIRPLGPADLSP